MALRFERLFGSTPKFWVNLQAQYDLEVAERRRGKKLRGLSSRWRRDTQAQPSA
jgi:plasmid maintenance system antidote protein VapI